ncbi:hypothetical protein [Yoonia sp.]|uniref:hypothetical protein n=1 Tax=Yoonia sp. TaxID=2212373 RepID=UPI003F6A5EB1
MSDKINTLIARIKSLEDELEEAFDEQRAALNMRIEHGRAVFDKEVQRRHAALRTGLLQYIVGSRPLIVLTAPVIYAVIIPFVLLDVFVTIYQAICFPVYGIEKVRRRDYLAVDRHRLQYLNALEKLNCVYCGYGNGLLAYAGEVAGRTEKFWCPIKHAQRMARTHAHYPEFADFGDAEAYRKRVADLKNHPKKAGKSD